MSRVDYRRSLADLKADVRVLGELVLDRLDTGLRGLATHDTGLAESVIEGDDTVNRRHLAIEGDCIDLFALQQPVAGDLRLVSASFKIVSDLERVGDLAVNLGHYARAARRRLDPEPTVIDIGQDVHGMLVDALTAYAAGDATACYEIVKRDDDIDARCARVEDRIVRELIETDRPGAPEWEIERLLDDVTRLLLTVRDLERVGDHAVNVASRTRYVVEGDPELSY